MAEMVARVFAVVTSVGDTVKSRDTLVILESIKKQIPVPTEDAGSSGR
jgi:biotin carboxyl carrier protein